MPSIHMSEKEIKARRALVADRCLVAVMLEVLLMLGIFGVAALLRILGLMPSEISTDSVSAVIDIYLATILITAPVLFLVSGWNLWKS